MKVTPLQYLDKAMSTVRDLGLLPEEPSTQDDPMVALLNQIATIDEERVIAITRTLAQTSVFNEIVREQVQAMEIGDRYQEITESFNSIRDDAKSMVDQLEDGKISTFERVNNIWMKATRGDIATRFEKIKDVYMNVSASTNEQIQREHLILNAYQDFRAALKQSEILALEILNKADGMLQAAKEEVEKAMGAVTAYTGGNAAEQARLEMARDEKMRALQDVDKRYQLTKDLSDNLTVSYNTSEVIMARLHQTNHAKERLYSQAVTFFSTNETVLTALTASFTGMFGLHESTRTVEAMKEGVSQSLEVLADMGGEIQEAAIKTGYGPTIRADAVKKLVDSVVNFQVKSQSIIDEMRTKSTENAKEIREAVEDGKRRMAQLAEEGKGLAAPAAAP